MKEDSYKKEEDVKDISIINSSEDKDTSISTNSSEANAEICNQIVESIVSESEQIVKEKSIQDDNGKLIKLFYLFKTKNCFTLNQRSLALSLINFSE